MRPGSKAKQLNMYNYIVFGFEWLFFIIENKITETIINLTELDFHYQNKNYSTIQMELGNKINLQE